VAHGLARLAKKERMDMVWLREPPDCIHDTIKVERSALQLES
jgi:hypothetical protein